MLDADRIEFEKFVLGSGLSIRPDKAFSWISTPNGDIQYQLSDFFGSQITAGRIAIKTNDPRLSQGYKKLRRWITGRYDNDVYGKNDLFPQGATNPSRYPSMYIGPAAANAARSGILSLRQFKGGRVVFSLGIPLNKQG